MFIFKSRERECSELASLSEKPKCQSIKSVVDAVYDSETEPRVYNVVKNAQPERL
jgi:hypothetical protein